MRLLKPGGTYVIYGATDLAQRISTWLVLVKGLQITASAMDVRQFSMTRSAHVARIALNIMISDFIDSQPTISEYVSFQDEEAVRQAFLHYGSGRSMKTALVASCSE
jgi:L-iditol 2-dehydrogenase/threonine 3-dehydrogenase